MSAVLRSGLLALEPLTTVFRGARAHRRPDSTPVAAETPLGFFEKFYAPHGNQNWKQLDARGLAQIILNADRRRAEYQKRVAAKSLPAEEEVRASKRAAVNMPNDRQKKRLSPGGAEGLGALDVSRKNSYIDDLISELASFRPPEFQGHAAEAPDMAALADAEGAERLGRKAEDIGAGDVNPAGFIDASGLNEENVRHMQEIIKNKYPQYYNPEIKAELKSMWLGSGEATRDGRIIISDEYGKDGLTNSEKAVLFYILLEEYIHHKDQEIFPNDFYKWVYGADMTAQDFGSDGLWEGRHDEIHKIAGNAMKNSYKDIIK